MLPQALGWALKWVLLSLLVVLLTGMLAAPAELSAYVLARQSRFLSLSDCSGLWWRGNGLLNVRLRSGEFVALPLRLHWRLDWGALLQGRPTLWVGQALEAGDAAPTQSPSLANTATTRPSPDATSLTPGAITLGRLPAGGWQLSLPDVRQQFPAAWLKRLGAPFNTLELSGLVRLDSQQLSLEFAPRSQRLHGTLRLSFGHIASRLSRLPFLGDYQLDIVPGAGDALIRLQTTDGPLILEGQGQISGGRLRFDGVARATAGFETQLSGLIAMLGQNRNGQAVLHFE